MAQGRYKALRHCVHTIDAFETAMYDPKKLEDTRLDDGTTNIDSLDAALRMNLTTTVNSTLRELQFARMEDWDWDLLEVSSYAGARPGCAPYQGRIYSRSGKDKKYPALADTSYGKPAGLFGINCHHTFFPFLPGVSKPTFSNDPAADMGKDNHQMYLEQQQQRAFERDIRKEKRVYMAGKAAGDQEVMTKASVRLKDKEQQLTKFLKDTGRTRYSERQQVVGYGRSEAAQTRSIKQAVDAYQSLAGKETKNLMIQGVSKHFGEQAIWRGVSQKDVLDALNSPLNIGKIKIKEGRLSQEYIGDQARVIINPETSNLVTVWKTSSKLRNKYGGK